MICVCTDFRVCILTSLHAFLPFSVLWQNLIETQNNITKLRLSLYVCTSISALHTGGHGYMIGIMTVPQRRMALYPKINNISLLPWKKLLISLLHSQTANVTFEIQNRIKSLSFFFYPPQGALRGLHDPLGQLRVQPGQSRAVWEQWPVAGHAVGRAAEAAGPRAVVWCFQGGPGSHEVAEALLQVSMEYYNVMTRSLRGRLAVLLCSVSSSLVGLRMVKVCFIIINGNLDAGDDLN